MPELPEVETVRKGLQSVMVGKTIARVRLARADLRFPFPKDFSSRLQGKRIEHLSRRGKYLLFHLSGKWVWIAHLGMSGRFIFLPAAPEHLGKHDHALFVFTDESALVFNDARRFGVMDLVPEKNFVRHLLLKNLGPDPFARAFTPTALKKQLSKRHTSIKAALMDQRVVAGIGNIYASEALFAARLDPRTPAHVAAEKSGTLIKAIRAVLRSAIASGGSSLRDFFHTDGEIGSFQHRFQVYGRAGKSCFVCGSPLQQLVQGGRSTFFCPNCQASPLGSSCEPRKARKTALYQGRKKSALGA